MQPRELSRKNLIEILKTYKKYLGDYAVSNYIKNPEMILDEVRNCGYSIEYYRIGSKWTDDTKLGFRTDINSRQLEILVYLNYGIKDEKILKEFNNAQKKFLQKVSEILKN